MENKSKIIEQSSYYSCRNGKADFFDINGKLLQTISYNVFSKNELDSLLDPKYAGKAKRINVANKCSILNLG